MENFLAATELRNAAAIQHRDALGERESFVAIMGNQNYRHAQTLHGAIKIPQQGLPAGGVQCGERFIEEQQVGLEYQRAG